jgi:PIN domain nuclease of toxin-antitoxin system
MKLLLDTHTFIWFINGDKSLPAKTKKTIANLENSCFISIASIWEIAIKLSLKKLKLKSGFDKIAEFINENDIEILPVSFNHLQQLMELEFHHRGPFDRIIIAQSITEQLTVLTKDDNFKLYPVKIMWN